MIPTPLYRGKKVGSIKALFSILSLTLFLAACSTGNKSNETNNNPDTSFSNQLHTHSSKIELKISLRETVLKKGNPIFLNISLTNCDSIDRTVLFDKPISSTGGPWGIFARITDYKTNKSVLKYTNKALLSSQLHTDKQLQDGCYVLKPKQAISKEYQLTDIVVFNSTDFLLPKGQYEVQLHYYIAESNRVLLTIQ